MLPTWAPWVFEPENPGLERRGHRSAADSTMPQAGTKLDMLTGQGAAALHSSP